MAKRRKQTKRQTVRVLPQSERVLRTGALRKTPREQDLPGMENRRIKALDEVCASIADCRGSMNDLRAQEGDLERHALKLMHKHEKQTWQHAGVELLRVPGEEKLRVRTSRTAATAEVEEPEPEPEPETSHRSVNGSDDEPLRAMDAIDD